MLEVKETYEIGNRLKAIKTQIQFDETIFKENEIYVITNIDENLGNVVLELVTNKTYKIVVDVLMLSGNFIKIEDKMSVTEKQIDDIINNSEIHIDTLFNKCTVVSIKLPNGFVIVESSACVSPENYDEDLGTEICMKRIKDKLWELEGYNLQSKLFESSNINEEERNIK